MSIKSILQNLETPIVALLPHGAINRLAKQHRKARQSISRMLRGEDGSEENIQAVLSSALEIIEGNIEGASTELANIRKLVNRTQSVH